MRRVIADARGAARDEDGFLHEWPPWWLVGYVWHKGGVGGSSFGGGLFSFLAYCRIYIFARMFKITPAKSNVVDI